MDLCYLCYQTRNFKKNSTSEFQPPPEFGSPICRGRSPQPLDRARSPKLATLLKALPQKNTHLMYGRFINVPHRYNIIFSIIITHTSSNVSANQYHKIIMGHYVFLCIFSIIFWDTKNYGLFLP